MLFGALAAASYLIMVLILSNSCKSSEILIHIVLFVSCRSINPILDTLLRIAPEIYRSFTALIGPVVDSTLPLSSTSVGSSTAASGEANAFELGGGGSGSGGGGSFDGNKFHRPRSTVGLSKSHSSDLLNRPRG